MADEPKVAAARELWLRGRHSDALRIARTEPGAEAVLLAARIEMERGRMPEAARLLTHDLDDDLVRLWHAYLTAMILPTDEANPLDHAVRVVADAAGSAAPGGGQRGQRVAVEAVVVRARLTKVRVLYLELPATAARDAATDFAVAARGYHELGLVADAWTASRLRYETLRSIPGEPLGPILSGLDAAAAEARDGHPFAEAELRRSALEIRTAERLGAAEADLTDVLTEAAAIGRLLHAAGHAYGEAWAVWPVVTLLLRHGFEPAVELARQCAAAFTAAEADHLALEVWRNLEQFHAERGEGTLRRGARATLAQLSARRQDDSQWQLYDLVTAISSAELLFRTGQIGRARALMEQRLRSAPHRHARVSLRVMLSAQLASVGLTRDAAEVLRAAATDLASVFPSVFTGEVLAQLAAAEADLDPGGAADAALARAGDAIKAARAIGNIAEVGRFLTLRGLLRARLAVAAGRRPALDAATLADLAEAEELLRQSTSTEGRRALVGVYETYGQIAFFDGDIDTGQRGFAAAADVAGAHGLGPERAFALSYAGMAGTQDARNRRDVAGYETAAARLTEAYRLFVAADLTQIAWRAGFLAANTQWEAARVIGDRRDSRQRMRQALAGFERTAAELDVLRGVAGGDTAVDRQRVGIGFGLDKQEVYRTGFHLAVSGLADPALALRWLERMKSRALLDAMAALPLEATQHADLASGNPLMARERELLAARRTAEGFEQLTALARDLEQVWNQLAASPETAGYAALRRTRAPDWPQVRTILAAEGERTGRRHLIAQYYVEPGRVLLFGLAPDWKKPRMRAVRIDTVRLASYVRSTFRTSGGVRMMMQDSVDGGLSAWYAFSPLVTPIAQWAADDDVVHLVPYGMLHDLPLHTLPLPDRRPLGQRYPVCYAPSLGVLLHTLERSPAPASTVRAAVFGDPRNNLPWAVEEAHAVASVLGAEPVTGGGVTRSAVLAALRQAGTVHLAGHARASVDDGLTSGVELAGDDTLRAADLLLHPVGAQLVALSGCETGVSEHRPGDEGIGLIRALLHSGARAMLTSQWRVNDESAQRLLAAFHRYDQTLIRADALRRAMVETAAEPGREHFYHWGGFVLVGDGR